ncbi:hypothetical protein ACQKNX_08315 [Lysinibacillus sp. NPDC093712]|uniref:hypothetical protein n=1 Tax=Lysinibacillus sp. NPDC093712 TaxID=3390579 RepID=UPI003CFC9CE7
MKLNIVRNLENGIYNVEVKSVTLDTSEQELIKDAVPQKLDIAGDITKTSIINVITKEPIVDELGVPVLDELDQPTFKEITTPTEKVEVLLRLGSKFKTFPIDIPFSRSFSVVDFGEIKAQELAESYADTIQKRIEEIMTKLRAKPDTYSRDEEIII